METEPFKYNNIKLKSYHTKFWILLYIQIKLHMSSDFFGFNYIWSYITT